MWEELFYEKLPNNFYTTDLEIYVNGCHLRSDALPFKTIKDKRAIVTRLKNGEKLWIFHFDKVIDYNGGR